MILLNIKKWFMRLFILSLVITVIALLFHSKILFYKYENMIITVGVSGKYHNETVSETIKRTDIELEDTQKLIDDARNMGILD
jgi:hypothetical protein